MVIKLIAQLIWEAAILPAIRFIIRYLPMIVSIIISKELTIQYFVKYMVKYSGFLEWLTWYIPAILVATLAFGVMAQNVKKIHPYRLLMMLVASLIAMRTGVTGIQVSLHSNEPPMLIDSFQASVFAVVSFYCMALIIQRAWVEVLPKRKK